MLLGSILAPDLNEALPLLFYCILSFALIIDYFADAIPFFILEPIPPPSDFICYSNSTRDYKIYFQMQIFY